MAGNDSSARRQAEKNWEAAGKPDKGPVREALEQAKAKENASTRSSGGAISRALGF